MRRYAKLIFLLSAFFLATTWGDNPAHAQQGPPAAPESAVSGSSQNARAKYAENEILVKFKDTAAVDRIPGRTPPIVATGESHLSETARTALTRVGSRVKKAYLHTGVNLVSVPETLSVQEAIEEMNNSGEVEFAEPNYVVHADKVPNDPSFSQQWGLNNIGSQDPPMTVRADIGAPDAWQWITNSSPTVVVIIDSGVDYNHEDLVDNMWKNPAELAGVTGTDEDHNEYVDDIYGINAADHNVDPMDIDGHGTHCAGTIGAVGNNGKGITGVAWKAQIMPLKFMAHQSGYLNNAIECINYALAIKSANQYPRMIFNLSWGWDGSSSQALYNSLKSARNAGVLVVTSAGNTGKNSDLVPHYPSSYDLDNIIRVGGSDANDVPASWSNYGISSVDLFAPGANIFSTLPGNTYGNLSGTSCAAPFVSGAAALVWSAYPDLTYSDIKGLIFNGVESGRSPATLYGKCLTQGRLYLRASLAKVRLDDPSIFSITPTIGAKGDQITIVGNGLGSYGSTLLFGSDTLAYDSIVSWDPKQIVLTLPQNLPFGMRLLKVNSYQGISRGAVFRSGIVPRSAGATRLPHALAASAQIGQDLWIIGGISSTGATGMVERYNLLTGNSGTAPLMPYPLAYAGAAPISNKIYVVGGLVMASQKPMRKLQILDLAGNNWTTGKDLPFALYQAAVVSVDDLLFVFGGTNGQNKVVASTLVYDPATDTWTRRTPPPVSTTYASAVRIENTPLVMLVGGSSKPGAGGSALRTVQVYNVETDSWQSYPLLSRARYGAGTVYGGSTYCLFGAGSDTQGFSDGEFLTDTAWQTAFFGYANLLSPIVAKWMDQVYIIGGKDLNTGNCLADVMTFQAGS